MTNQVRSACAILTLCLAGFCGSAHGDVTKGVLSGHVYDQYNCAPVAGLTVKLTPSDKLENQSQLITTTDGDGDFEAKDRELGDYYVSLFQGLSQLYGHVISFRGENQTMIALKPLPSGRETKTVGCVTPVALALSSTNDLIVLDSHLGILQFSTKTSTSRRLAEFRSSWQPVDLAIGTSEGQLHLFVNLVQGSVGQLMQYSQSGRFETSWFSFSPLSGLAVDSSAGRVYTAAWGKDQIFQQSFPSDHNSRLESFSVSSGHTDWGPLAIDSKGAVLYAAEQFKGEIFAFNLRSSSMNLVAHGIGQPSAMEFDATGKRLLVADADGRDVWVVPVSSQAGRPSVLFKARILESPSGIAVSNDGTVWVGDQRAHALFQFDSRGHLLKTIK